MATSPLQVRDRLRTRFLGKYGIHGLYLDQKRRTIEVFVELHKDTDLDSLRSQLIREAEPLEVVLIPSPAPVAF